MTILGIDEVGRGPLAGPLVVGAVVIPEYLGPRPEWINELRDSKKLSAKKREYLSEIIWKEIPAGLGWVSAAELDALGVSEALKLATRRAVKSVQGLHAPFSQIVIDGKVNFLNGTSLERFVSVMPKADNLVREVSAASIVAKVARDKYMVEISADFPEYGFEKHVGYGTAKHLAAIREFGVCPEHRKSFEPIKSMVGFDRNSDEIVDVVKNTTMMGSRAEEKVAEYLTGLGHEIVVRNFKTKFCEIDIVSVFEGKIYFTEVKYRRSDFRGGGFAAIDFKKQQKMRFAAESFLKFRREFAEFSPLLAAAEVFGDEFKISGWIPLS